MSYYKQKNCFNLIYIKQNKLLIHHYIEMWDIFLTSKLRYDQEIIVV